MERAARGDGWFPRSLHTAKELKRIAAERAMGQAADIKKEQANRMLAQRRARVAASGKPPGVCVCIIAKIMGSHAYMYSMHKQATPRRPPAPRCAASKPRRRRRTRGRSRGG